MSDTSLSSSSSSFFPSMEGLCLSLKKDSKSYLNSYI
jgi:hypothetical protein